MPPSRNDVLAAVATAFAQADAAAALAMLDLYGEQAHERERERVQLAIVALSQGSKDRLRHFVQAAKTDYRDVLLWQAGGPVSPQQGESLRQQAQALLRRWGVKGGQAPP